jgi:hypothetical protein
MEIIFKRKADYIRGMLAFVFPSPGFPLYGKNTD